MSSSEKRSGTRSVLLIGFVLLVLGALVGFVPIVVCPLNSLLVYTPHQCPLCRDRGRITLPDWWRNKGFPKSAWEGMEIGAIETSGFIKVNISRALGMIPLRKGMLYTNQGRIDSAQGLWDTGWFGKVHILPGPDPVSAGKVILRIVVEEK